MKATPLRPAGQSVQDEIDRIFEHDVNDAGVPLALTFVLFDLAVVNFFLPASPLTLLLVCGLYFAGAVAWGVPRLIRARKKLRRLRQGCDGERAVAEYLDILRDDGFRVFHDLQGNDFNVDHVLVGPQGVYTIETKTISKPASGNPTVTYDGKEIRIGGFAPSRNPVTQATGQATWLRNLHYESTGKNFTVRPVVVFPGWFVEGPKGGSPLVWVLEPKMLRHRLREQPTFIDDTDVNLCAFHLKRFMRGP